MCLAPINSRSRKRINILSQRLLINYGTRLVILPTEKQNNTIGRPIVPYRKVLDGIVYVLRTGCQWKMLPKEYGSGSTCHRRFREWIQLDFQKDVDQFIKII